MNWISITEKLPEDNLPVILFTPFDYFGALHSCVGNAESIRSCTVASGEGLEPIFTHWVPLPEYPSDNSRCCDN
ncbi:MAG: DUF551 domain-containing protein [Geobacter sp.]|jgi:hypothetical protein|nr:DUF551 domain-containing protein [Geobacter sp.]